MSQPLTEDGAIVGSIPYMSPEQAEGRPVDARSDIFSFGALLYEMVTGQRAFQGESRISTLAAVVQKDPPSVSGIIAAPPELDRLIARCLRKDVSKRSQNMSDVKLALEELREESESGAWLRASAASSASALPAGRRWLWPAVAGVCLLMAAAALAWSHLRRRDPAAARGPELTRISPDDGYSYEDPSLSSDGKFVAYVSDRSGKPELWLQQVGGGDPIQLTHDPNVVAGPQFSSDATRILYRSLESSPRRVLIESIPTLGGQPKVVAQFEKFVGRPRVSPDGRHLIYVDGPAGDNGAFQLMILPLEGGAPRVMANWARTQRHGWYFTEVRWSADGRFVLGMGVKRAEASFNDWDWFALPVDGGAGVATGAGDLLRAAGLSPPLLPPLMVGDRAFFTEAKSERGNLWEIRLDPVSWKATGPPRKLTFGTDVEILRSVSTGNLGALQIVKSQNDLY